MEVSATVDEDGKFVGLSPYQSASSKERRDRQVRVFLFAVLMVAGVISASSLSQLWKHHRASCAKDICKSGYRSRVPLKTIVVILLTAHLYVVSWDATIDVGVVQALVARRHGHESRNDESPEVKGAWSPAPFLILSDEFVPARRI